MKINVNKADNSKIANNNCDKNSFNKNKSECDNSSSERNYINKIIKNICDSQNLPKVTLDESDHCMVLFDEKIIINIDFNEDKNSVIIYSYVGDVPVAFREEAYKMLLEGNFFWKETDGATLSLDKQSQSIVLEKECFLPFENDEFLEDQFADFVDIYEKWSARIEKLVKQSQQTFA